MSYITVRSTQTSVTRESKARIVQERGAGGIKVRSVLVVLAFMLFTVASAQTGTVLERQLSAGGPEPLHYTVYLPDGYDRDERSYPVVYLLHTYLGSDTDWVRYGGAADIADSLITADTIPPLILVMPDAKNSWYINSPGYGQYETALLSLMNHVDSTYRTIPERGSRAVGGASMGGYGAARLAIKYPERFAAAAVMSGAVFAEVPEYALGAHQKVFGTPLDRARYQRERPETLLRRWGVRTPRPAFYLSVGDNDTITPYGLSVRLQRALQDAGAESQLRVTDGAHVWPVFESALENVLIFFAVEFERYSAAPVRPPVMTP